MLDVAFVPGRDDRQPAFRVHVAPMPTARHHLAAVAVNGKIYAIGGMNSSSILNTVEVYDPSSSAWSTAASLFIGRSGLGAADANGFIYAIGGADTS